MYDIEKEAYLFIDEFVEDVHDETDQSWTHPKWLNYLEFEKYENHF